MMNLNNFLIILRGIIIYIILYLLINHKYRTVNEYKQYICELKENKKFKTLNMILIKKIKYIKNLSRIIIQLKKIYLYKFNKKINNKDSEKNKIDINIILIIFLSIILSIIIYIISYKIINIKSTAVIISIISFFIPYNILKFLVILEKNKILNDFPEYILNLKRNVKTDNNIIFAFKNTNVPNTIKVYIDKFNIAIDRGTNVYESFEMLKTDIDIPKISTIITIIQNCYIYGGNFEQMLDKYAKNFLDDNIQKTKQRQDLISTKVTTIVLIVINIYLACTFIYKNQEYYDILTKTKLGICIINFVILSYIVIFNLIFNDKNEYI